MWYYYTGAKKYMFDSKVKVFGLNAHVGQS